MDSKNSVQEIHIRKARPVHEDGLAYASLLDKTSEGFIRKLLGKDAYEIIVEAFMKPNNEYSYENAAFAVQGDSICGMISGYTFEMKRKFLSRILAQSTKGKKRDIRRFHFVGSTLMRGMGARHPGEYYLQAIIVTEDYRGRGLGKKLMSWIEYDAFEKGARSLALDVSSKNKSAVNLYQGQGMTIDSHWPRFPLLPSVFTRMSKKLSMNNIVIVDS